MRVLCITLSTRSGRGKPIFGGDLLKTDNIIYKKKLVAYLDILGFKNLVNQNKKMSKKSILFIDEHLRRVIESLNDNNDIFSAKMFSDCICLSCDYSYKNLEAILYELSYMQLYFSFEGIFLRGALSADLHFENDLIIYSRGLVKSYKLEQIANFPRILINNELTEVMNYKILKDSDEEDLLMSI